MLFILKNLLKRLLKNSPPLSTSYLFGLRPLDFALTIVMPLLSFKGITQEYLLKISIAHSKYLIICLVIAYQLNEHPKYCL